MQSIFEIQDEKTLHHFYLIKSSFFDTKKIKEHCHKIFVSEFDLIEFNYDVIFVDQAREIVDLANRRIADNKKYLFLIKANSINFQAQNSLLKSLEEPTTGLHFFLILPEINNILPTVLSRAMILNEDGFRGVSEFQNFTQLKLEEQISFISKMVADIKDGKKTKQDAVNLADFIIEKLNQDVTFKKNNSHRIKQIIEFRDFIMDNGSSVKSLLEFIVLALPQK
jgi:DNA polymerase III gamma/tau subunit